MIEVKRTLVLDETPTSLWARIGAFAAIGEWHPAVVSVTLSLADARERRTLELADGALLIEDRIDDGSDSFAYEYRVAEGPLPVANYTSRFFAEPHGTGTKITWSSLFDADGVEDIEAEMIIVGIYEEGLDAIVGGA